MSLQIELENAVGGAVSGEDWPGATVDVIIKDSDDARGVFRFKDDTLRQNVEEMHDGGKTNTIKFKREKYTHKAQNAKRQKSNRQDK